MPPLVIDPTVQKFQEFADSIAWPKLAAESALETASRVYRMCPPPQHTLSGIEAANYLQIVLQLTQADILEQHCGYGSVRWLWYLRRAPDTLFEGSYRTTMGYDRLLAEVLSSQFKREDSSELAQLVRFRIDGSAFRHLARYIGRVKLLSNLHILYRRVGKGSVLDASSPVLVAETSEHIEHAIQIYDTRHDRSHEFVGAGLGMFSVEPNIQQLVDESSGGDPTAFLTIGCTPSFPAPITYPDGAGGLSIATVQVRHIPKMLNLERILAPMGEEGGLPD